MDHGNKKLQIIIFAVSYTCDAMNHTLSGKLNITFIYLFFLYLYKICNVKTDADTRVSYLATELFVFTAVFSLLSCLQLAGKKKDIDLLYLKMDTTQIFRECLYIHLLHK